MSDAMNVLVWLVGIVLSAICSLGIIAAVVYVIVTVLRAMGVEV